MLPALEISARLEPVLTSCLGERATAALRHHGFTLTKIIIFLSYYFVGVLYYSQAEGWTPSECIYFVTVTVCTVGYGTYHPTTDNSRLFTIFFILYGLFFVLPIANVFAVRVGVRIQNRFLSALKKWSVINDNQWLVQHFNRGAISIFFILCCVVLGVIVYTANEGWTFVTALYFTIVTMTTVGYGDIAVTKDSTRWFGVFFILLCVLVFATALNTFGVIYGDVMLVRKRNDLFKKTVNIARLEELASRPQGIDKLDFLLEILLQLELVDRKRDLEPLLRKFDELDKFSVGYLTAEDIATLKLHELGGGSSGDVSPVSTAGAEQSTGNSGAGESAARAASTVFRDDSPSKGPTEVEVEAGYSGLQKSDMNPLHGATQGGKAKAKGYSDNEALSIVHKAKGYADADAEFDVL